jgi:hypothetical protein
LPNNSSFWFELIGACNSTLNMVSVLEVISLEFESRQVQLNKINVVDLYFHSIWGTTEPTREGEYWSMNELSTFGAKVVGPRPDLVPKLTLCRNGLKWAPTWLMMPNRTIVCERKDFQACYIVSANHGLILRRRWSPNAMNDELPVILVTFLRDFLLEVERCCLQLSAPCFICLSMSGQ